MDAVKPRRKWPRRVVFVLFALAVIIFAAPLIFSRTGLVQSQIQAAAADFDGTVTVGGISLSWFSPVELRDIVVNDTQGRTLASVPNVVTSKTLLGFVLDRQNLGTVTLQRPTVEVVCEANTTNWETSLKRILDAPSSGSSPDVAIVVEEGTLTVIDGPKRWSYEKLDATAKLGSSLAVILNIPGQVKADFSPELATVNATGFALEPLGPLLRRFEPGLTLKGTLRGTLATTGNVVESGLQIDGFEACVPTLSPSPIPLETIAFPFKLTRNGTILNVSVAKITCPLAEATFIGTVDVAKPEAVLRTPAVTAGAVIHIAKIAKYVPNIVKLQAGTQLTDGTISIQATSAADGVWNGLWKGLIATTTLKGMRNGQPLVWNEPIVMTFAGRLDEKYQPNFEAVRFTSDFANVVAAGSLQSLTMTANISLDKLGGHLGQFIDMSHTTLMGQATASYNGGQAGLELKGVNATGATWAFAGDGTVNGRVNVSNDTVRLENVAGELKNARFRGLGLDVDEPIVKLLDSDASYRLANGSITVPRLQLATQTVSVGAASTGNTLEASITANLARVQKTLAIAGEPLAGVCRARINTNLDNGKSTLAAKFSDFHYGTLWTEPAFDISADVTIANTVITVNQSAVGGLQGLGATAKGTITDFTKLDLTGDLAYELDKLQPKLRAMLGNSFSARGYGTKPFHLKGNFDNPTLLVGDASVAWQSIVAYGFDVGGSQLNANVANGVLTTTPIEALFSGTGKVKLEPTLRFQPNTYDVTFKPGRVIEKATLTPKACAEALGFALPAIAKSTQAEGTISFDLADNRVLLTNINGSTLKGTLTLHDASVTAGPVISEVAKLFGETNAKLVLAKEQPVAIRVEKGRVWHEQMKLSSHGWTVTTTGSVGFDGSLNMTAEVPLPEKALGNVLKATPAIRDAMAKQKVTIPIGGTIDRPALDRKAFDAAVAQFIREVTKDAAKGKLDELLQKGLEKAIPKKP